MSEGKRAVTKNYGAQWVKEVAMYLEDKCREGETLDNLKRGFFLDLNIMPLKTEVIISQIRQLNLLLFKNGKYIWNNGVEIGDKSSTKEDMKEVSDLMKDRPKYKGK